MHLPFSLRSFAAAQLNEEQLSRNIVSMFQETRNGSNTFVLGDATPFEWDRVHVFGEYTSIMRIEISLGFRWRIGGIHGTGMMDNAVFLVFVRDRRVAGCARISQHDMAWPQDQIPAVMSKDEAIFDILPAPDEWSGPVLKKIEMTCPAEASR